LAFFASSHFEALDTANSIYIPDQQDRACIGGCKRDWGMRRDDELMLGVRA